MSIDLSCLIAMLLVKTRSAVVLSVCIGMGGGLWPIFSNAWRAGIASLRLMKRDPNSASAAEYMTFFSFGPASNVPKLTHYGVV